MFSRIKAFAVWYKPYLKTFVFIMISAILLSGLTLLVPLITRYITKDVLTGDPSQAPELLMSAGLVLLAVVSLQVVLSFHVDIRGHILGAEMERDMRNALFAHLTRQSFRFYDRSKTGALMSRLTNDLLNIAELAHHVPEESVIYSIRLIGALVILFIINAKLAAGILLFLPILAIFGIYFNQKMRRALALSRERIAEVNSQAEDTISGIRTVQAFTNETLEQRRFGKANRLFFESRSAIYKNESWFYTGFEALIHLLTVGVTIFGALAITRQRLDLPDLLTFFLYIGSLTAPILSLIHTSLTYQEGMAGFTRFQALMNQFPDVADRPDAQPLDLVRGDIRFENVTFRYQESNKPVLARLDLSLLAGETVALVGPSGAGKTTLCSLIPRFYDIEEGGITIDGLDIRNIRLESLRQHIGVVQQDVFLFSGTVMENIQYGSPDASADKIEAAARKAGAHDFIQALPKGYETEIGERGVRLSGGQKQRLSLARVFLKDPPILIFDEATSALDQESEQVVREAMSKVSQGRTTVIIAHRLSTVRHADRVIVLTEEGIEEQGTHENLLKARGTYARLYGIQMEKNDVFYQTYLADQA